MSRIQNKNILVTGATSGIGRASVVKLAENGANLVITGRNEDAGQDLINSITTLGCKAKFIKCDLSDKKQIAFLFEETFEFLGKLDCAFNNAGIEGEVALFDKSSEENWDNVFNINLKSIWHCMKHEIRHMLNNNYGTIINMSSTSGFVGNGFGMTAYAASKHALIGLSKSVALEYAKNGIRVIAICPGFVETPMVDKVCETSPALRRRFTASHPIGRMGKPEEIGDAIVFLCSDESSFITGNSFVIDGGLTI